LAALVTGQRTCAPWWRRTVGRRPSSRRTTCSGSPGHGRSPAGSAESSS